MTAKLALAASASWEGLLARTLRGPACGERLRRRFGTGEKPHSEALVISLPLPTTSATTQMESMDFSELSSLFKGFPLQRRPARSHQEDPQWGLTRLGFGRLCADGAFSVELDVAGSQIKWERAGKTFRITGRSGVSFQSITLFVSSWSIEHALPLQGQPSVLLKLSHSPHFEIGGQRVSHISPEHQKSGSVINSHVLLEFSTEAERVAFCRATQAKLLPPARINLVSRNLYSEENRTKLKRFMEALSGTVGFQVSVNRARFSSLPLFEAVLTAFAQIDALWRSGLLTPGDILSLAGEIKELESRRGSNATETVLVAFADLLRRRGRSPSQSAGSPTLATLLDQASSSTRLLRTCPPLLSQARTLRSPSS